MFVTTHGDQIWVVNQYDHAQQAGEVAGFWGNQEFVTPSPAAIHAVAQHDIGWVEVDEEILFDEESGKPVNFIDIDLKQHVQLYSKGYKKMLGEDPYAGMLIGMHWIGLYTSRFGYDPTFTYKIPEELKSYMENIISATQKEWIDIKMSFWRLNEKRSLFEDKIWMDYEFLQVMDRMSQLISINTPTDKVEVVLGPVRKNLDCKGVQLTVVQPGNGTVIVDPFPFRGEFDTTVKVRKIPAKRYDSHAELKETLQSTPYEEIRWSIVRK